ncbi:MAG: amidohydrolase [Thermoprotei archaeon]
MSTYYLVYSEKGIILSYKPLIVADALITTRNEVLLAGTIDYIEKVGSELSAKVIKTHNTLLPGFIDSHMHLDSLGFELSTINLLNTRDRGELLEKLKGLKPVIGDWIIGGRFDHLVYPDKKPPTRRELDSIQPDHPLLLIHRSGHIGVLNTRGIEEAVRLLGSDKGIDRETGVIREDSLWRLRRTIMSSLSIEDYAKLVKKAEKHLLNNGITSIGLAGCNTLCLDALEYIVEEKSLDIRVYTYLSIEKLGDTVELLPRIARINSMNSKLRINGIKLFADGALGPRTAYLSKPYSDKPGEKGVLLLDYSTLYGFVEKASKYGLQVAIHAIGDAALDNVLKAYDALREYVRALNHRIEHASLVRDDQLELVRIIKPVVVVQPHFIITDKWVSERIGWERINWVYRLRSLYEATTIAFSTDAPVEPVNPMETIYAAITRGLYDGIDYASITMGEALGLLESLYAYTRGAAIALRDPRLGCLLPGCYPDIVEASQNPLEIRNPRELLSIRLRVLQLE